MSISALFTIEGVATPAEVETTYGATVDLALLSTTGVRSVTWEIIGVSSNLTLASAPSISLAGSPSGITASFVADSDPGDGRGIGYCVQCTVSDGKNTATSTGIVGVRGISGIIPPVANERLARHATLGWLSMLTDIATGITLSVRTFGAAGDGTTDDTTAIQAALTAVSSSGGVVYFPPGTYVISSTLLVYSNTKLVGGGNATTIKLGDALDAIGIRSAATSAPYNSNITISGLQVDGNQAGQTPTAEATGIKMFAVSNLLLADLYLHDIEGHGIHVHNNGQTVTGQRFANVVIDTCGSGPTNTYGSCFAVTDGTDVIFTACHAYNSAKAGFRFSGTGYTFNGCVAKGNGNGGLVPVGGDCDFIVVNGGHFSDNLPASDWPCDGIRLVGNKQVQITGAICGGNSDCGIAVLNGCEKVTITGGVVYNNGQSVEAAGATNGRSGIKVWGTSDCDGVTIRDVTCYDDQGSPTQDYGVEVTDGAENVFVDGCLFGTNEVSGLVHSGNADTIRLGPNNRGVALPAFDVAGGTLTGTTATTALKTVSIPAHELGRRGNLLLSAGGEFAGGAGTKTISIALGGSALTFTASASGSTDDWRVEAEISQTSETAQRIRATLFIGTTVESMYGGLSGDTSADADFELRGKLTDGADSIVLRTFDLTRSR